MQNFTFGRKGTNWFLFAFVLLIGTLPSFGQEDCPTLGDANPEDFCYLDDINDLTDATNPDGDVVWYRDAALTQPIPSNELLEDEATYYAGNTDGDCLNPEAVTVTVETLDAPISEYGNIYSPFLESETATRTIENLIQAIDSTQQDNELVVYETELGTDTYDEEEELIDGQSYFVGQREPGNDCYSLRIAIRYSPDIAPAPTAESPQIFCQGATVADLEATGTSEDTQAFRWYSTETSNPALEEDEELRSGTYYVSQIVNDEGLPFPPTESEDRTAVTVEIIEFDAGEDASNSLCLSEVEARLETETPEQLFLSLVEGRDLPSEVSFNPSIQSIAGDFNENPIQTFTTEATFITEEGCEDTVVLSITVEESFEAGDDNLGNTLCRSDIEGEVTEITVQNYLISLLSENADENGEFAPSPSEIADDLNATSDEISFDIVYTVGEGTSCEDTANLEVTVFAGVDFESQLVNLAPLCNDDIPALVNEIPEDVENLFLANFGGNIPEGTFEEGDIQAVIDQYNQNNIDTFTATYIANTENGCSESIELSRTVIEGEDANAGSFDNIENICSNEESIDLTTLTNNDPEATQGGTFTGEGVSNNMFDPSAVEPGDVTITYTVDESIACVEGTEETTFTIEVIQGPDAGNDIQDSICISDVEEIAENFDPSNPEATLIQLFERFDWNGDIDGSFSPNVTILGGQLLAYYADENREPEITLNGTYTVGDSQDECGTDQASFAITIVDGELLDAGEDNTETELCNAQIPALVNSIPDDVEALYFDLLEEGVPENGTFDPSIQEIIADYNSDNFQTFNTTYTIGTDACGDSVELAITVIPASDANAGEIDDQVVCTTDGMITLIDYLDEDAQTTGIFTGDGVEDNMFDPSAGTSEITYTVNSDSDCVTEGTEDSTIFTISVIEPGEAIAEANDDTINICTTETSYELTNALSQNTTPGGSFTLNGEEFNGTNFDATAVEAGEYSFTYTVSSEDAACIEGEATASFTLNVTSDFDFGNDITDILCESEVPANLTADIIEDYYLGLVSGLPSGGTFSTTPEEILAQYNENPIDTFSTTYTVASGECQGSVMVSVTVQQEGDANAGEIENQVVCTTDGMINLQQYLVGTGAQMGGTFSGEGVEDNMFNTNMEADEYEITYTVTDAAPCVTQGTEDSNTFTIAIIEPGQAVADAMDDEIDVCTSETSYNLNDALSAESTQGGTFFLNGEEFNGTNFDATAVEAGEYSFTYTVSSEDAACIEGEATASFTLNVTSDFDFGNDITDILCESEVPANLTADIIEDYYLGLVSGLPSGGTFSTTPDEILAQYNENPIDTFSTTYTVASGECQGSVMVSVTVQEEGDANAGEIENQVVCTTDGMINLQQYLVGTGAQMGGTFSGEGVEDNMFNTNMEADEYEITYTVTDAAPCVTQGTEDSNTFTIAIIEPGQAVADAMDDEIDVCTSETSYNLNDALSAESTQGGTFFLNGEEFNGTNFDATAVEAGEYSFTYTVSSEDAACIEGEATASFTLNVTSEAFDAGEDETFTVCSVGLDTTPTVVEVRNYFLNLLEDGIPQNGTFSPSIEEIQEAYTAEQIGTFSTTYTLGNGNCEDSAELTVIVTDEIQAEVEEIADQTLCSSDENIDLFNYLTENSTQGGTFEGYENGSFSPSMMGAGSYEITYTVGEDIPCVVGEASTTFTIEVLQGANAGEDMDVTVCNNQPAQDLFDFISADADMDGEFTLNGEVITDGIMDPSTFEVGTYEVIYSVTAEDNECGGDDTAAITITLGDAPEAPATTGETVAFCAIDAPTAALLEAEGSNLTWYSDATLMTMVSDQDLLVSGEYYVTQTAESGCESEAAMITVNIVDSPAPTISADYELCEFDNPTLADLTEEIIETGEVTWYDSADSMTALSNNAMLTGGTTYYATLISDNGCESSERLAVTVTLEDCALLFPEAITPNGDGLNDRFVIENIESEYPNYNITIFNRWGSAVYKGNASVPAWDGTSNQSGSLGDGVLPVGVYFYVVDFNDGSTTPRQGKVYLNR